MIHLLLLQLYLSIGTHKVIAYHSARTTVLSPSFGRKTVYSQPLPDVRQGPAKR
jgi:hypothetical protein